MANWPIVVHHNCLIRVSGWSTNAQPGQEYDKSCLITLYWSRMGANSWSTIMYHFKWSLWILMNVYPWLKKVKITVSSSDGTTVVGHPWVELFIHRFPWPNPWPCASQQFCSWCVFWCSLLPWPRGPRVGAGGPWDGATKGSDPAYCFTDIHDLVIYYD